MDAIRGIEKPVVAEERQWQHHLLASNLGTPTSSGSQQPPESLATSRNQPCAQIVAEGGRLDIEGQHRWT